MAVVDPEAVERRREVRDVLRDVLPEPRVRRRAIPVAQLDAVAPDDDLAAQVRLRGREREVRERVGVPDPSIVSEGVDFGLSVLESGEVGFGNGVTVIPLAQAHTEQSCHARFRDRA